MTNGEKITNAFPKATVKSFRNMSGLRYVQVNFQDYGHGFWSDNITHTFSREWWDSEDDVVDPYNVIYKKKIMEFARKVKPAAKDEKYNTGRIHCIQGTVTTEEAKCFLICSGYYIGREADNDSQRKRN